MRRMMGYGGGSSRIKISSILYLPEDLPVVIELVDTRRKLEDFLDVIDPVIPEGVHVRLYRHKGKKG